MEDGDVQDVVSVGGYVTSRSFLPNNGQESGFRSKSSKKKNAAVAFYSVLSCFFGVHHRGLEPRTH